MAGSLTPACPPRAQIRQSPTPVQYAKRCAAYAHLGDYRRAIADAEAILQFDPGSPSAMVRMKNLKALIAAKNTCAPGSESAHLTLLIALTPRDLRQHRADSPSTYTMTGEALSLHARGAMARQYNRQVRPSSSPLAWKTRGGGADAALMTRAAYAAFAF
jgi:hypothetical protein